MTIAVLLSTCDCFEAFLKAFSVFKQWDKRVFCFHSLLLTDYFHVTFTLLCKIQKTNCSGSKLNFLACQIPTKFLHWES